MSSGYETAPEELETSPKEPGPPANAQTLRERAREECKKPLALEAVNLPEWGFEPGEAYVKALPGDDSELLEKATEGDVNRMAAWCVLCVCDADRNPIFEREDIVWLAAYAMAPLLRASSIAARLNGVDSDPAKNLPEVPPEDSPTTLPSN